MEEIRLIVSIVNHNSRDVLSDCLASIYRTVRKTQFEVFVIDNISTDGCEQMLAAEFPQVRLLRNASPMGFAANHNQVLRLGGARYHLILNPDTIVRRGTIDSLVDFMERHPEAGVAGPKVLNPDGSFEWPRTQVNRPISDIVHFASFISDVDLRPIVDAVRKNLGKERSTLVVEQDGESFYESGFLDGCCILVRKEAIDQVGVMDEHFFLYHEDTDWEKRIHDAGWKLYFVPGVEIVHLGGQSTSGSLAQYLKHLTIFIESCIVLYRKHYGYAATLLLRSVLTVVSLLNLLRWPLARLMRPSRRERAKCYFHFTRRLLPVLWA